MSASAERGLDFDPRVQPLQPDKSLGDLFGEMSNDIGTLVRTEIELAKTEATHEMRQMGRAAGMAAVAGASALLSLAFLSAGLAWLLDQALNRALSFAIVGALWLIVAAVLASSAKKQSKDINVLPITKTTLKEDAQWARAQKS